MDAATPDTATQPRPVTDPDPHLVPDDAPLLFRDAVAAEAWALRRLEGGLDMETWDRLRDEYPVDHVLRKDAERDA